jgi:hypothetical protein
VNVGDARVVLRLRTLSDILDLAFRVLFVHRRLFLRLGLLLLLPCLGVCCALRYYLGWSWKGVWVVGVLLGGLVQGGFTVAVGQLVFAETLSARAVLRRFVSRLPAYAATMLLSRLYAALGLLAMTVGLLATWPRVLYAGEATLLEGASPGQAFARSLKLVRRQFGPTLGLLLALLCAQFGFVVAAELLGQAAVEFVLQLGQPLGSLWSDGGTVYALAGFFVSVPYVAVARFLKYIDIRTGKEGWDIQLKFAALQAADEAARRIAA